MRFGPLAAFVLGTLLGTAAPAFAAPVQVMLKSTYGPLNAGIPVVAFSYDVEKVFPEIERRFEQWKPTMPIPQAEYREIPLLRSWNTFFLVHAASLEHYREDFHRVHHADDVMLRELMPQFDAVFRKYGDRPSDILDTILHPEDERQVWCQNITREINMVINAYNAQRGLGETVLAQYRQRHANWLGKRNEALRFAAMKAGGNPNLNFVESVTNEAGIASFDMPAGTWYVAAQTADFSWYRPMRVTNMGGKVALNSMDASRRRIMLAEWVGN